MSLRESSYGIPYEETPPECPEGFPHTNLAPFWLPSTLETANFQC